MTQVKHKSSLRYIGVDFRAHPEAYTIGRGEEGVLLAEPYKSEILPHWKFATPDIALVSAATIYGMFSMYRDEEDFVGMDMARKYLQMGYTRAMRYARHKGGKKYKGPVPADKKGVSGAHGREELPVVWDTIKLESARVFKRYWDMAAADPIYVQAKKDWNK